MKVVILAGGLGTRISEESGTRPKPMVEIGGKPILWHIMKTYSHYGFNEFVILLGYKGYVIKEFFFNYYLHHNSLTIDLSSNSIKYHGSKSEPWKVSLIDTGLNTMTGGRVAKISSLIGNEKFLLTYGDGLSDVNISDMIKFHDNHNGVMTMLSVQPEGRFGSINISKDKKVNSFVEKPKGDGGWINAGYFICEPEIFKYLPDDETLVLEKEPIEKLAKDSKLFSYQYDGFWKPMDSLKDKNDLNKIWQDSAAPWKVWL